MQETTGAYEASARRPISVAAYAAIGAMLLITVLSAITFAVSSAGVPADQAYDPSVSLLGFSEGD